MNVVLLPRALSKHCLRVIHAVSIFIHLQMIPCFCLAQAWVEELTQHLCRETL